MNGERGRVLDEGCERERAGKDWKGGRTAGPLVDIDIMWLPLAGSGC